jgi:cell wall-associated NlpC family hydrolase
MSKEIDIRKFYIPFKEKGRDYNGVDCWGIAYLIYRDILGIELPTYTEQYRNTMDRKEIANLWGTTDYEGWEKVNIPEPYDLVQIRMLGVPMHVGIYIGNNKFLHCLENIGTTIGRINSSEWRDRIVGYYRRKK